MRPLPLFFILASILAFNFVLMGCSHSNIKKQSFESSNKEQEPSDNQMLAPPPYFNWPVDSAVLVRGFLPKKKRPHLGLDLAASKGTPIFASHSGLVIYAGRDFKGFGKMILVEGEHGWATLYAHLSKIEVKAGETVNQGQEIGKMGRTGRASGVHLHFEIRQAKTGPVDPLLYLPNAQTVSSN